MTKNELRQIIKYRLHQKFSHPGAEIEITAESQRAWNRIQNLPAVTAAKTVMVYLNMRYEFPTLPYILNLVRNNRHGTLVIPWCSGDELELFRLISSADLSSLPEEEKPPRFEQILNDRLEPGAFGILEPKESLRNLPFYHISPAEIDTVLLPGLGFDSRCRRLGRGRGFYDRFLKHLRPDVFLVGLAFDEQIVEIVPTEPHDRSVDILLTPTRTFTLRNSGK